MGTVKNDNDLCKGFLETVSGVMVPVAESCGRDSRASVRVRAASLVDGLVINADRMRQNLEHTGDLFFSEGVMLALVQKGMARQAAYELVQRSALATAATLGRGGVAAGQPSFRQRLAEDPEVAAKLTPADLDHAFDLKHHTRYSDAIIERALRDRDH